MCGDQHFNGPIITKLWDDNFFFCGLLFFHGVVHFLKEIIFLVGGDEKVQSHDHMVEAGEVLEIRYSEQDESKCPTHFHPYVVFTSYCKVYLICALKNKILDLIKKIAC